MNHEKGNISANKVSSISFAHPTARKNYCWYSFMTVAEWSRLPATIRKAPSVDAFRAKLCSIKLSTHFTRSKIA